MNNLTIPHSFEAEQTVIGAAIVGGAWPRVAAALKESDFLNPAHRMIWQLAQGLDAEGRPVEPAAIAAKSHDTAMPSTLRDAIVVHLAEAAEGYLSTSTIEAYAEIVRNKRIERELLNASGKLRELVVEPAETREKLDQAQRLVMGIGQEFHVEHLVSAKDALPSALARLEQRAAVQGIYGVPTGFLRLDERLGGLERTDLVVLAARPSMGKTALAMNIACSAASAGYQTLVFSLEMGRDQLVNRCLSALGDVPLWRLRDGSAIKEEPYASLLLIASSKLGGWPLYIDDSVPLTVLDVRARARLHRMQHGEIGLIVIDYLQLMDGEGKNPNERVSNITRGLKLLAKELECPVLVLSQLNRELERRDNKRPILADLRDSGAVEQDADVVLFIYRDEIYHPETSHKGIAEVITAKFRNGPIGTDYLSSRLQFSRFEDFIGDVPDEPPPEPEANRWARGMDSW